MSASAAVGRGGVRTARRSVAFTALTTAASWASLSCRVTGLLPRVLTVMVPSGRTSTTSLRPAMPPERSSSTGEVRPWVIRPAGPGLLEDADGVVLVPVLAVLLLVADGLGPVALPPPPPHAVTAPRSSALSSTVGGTVGRAACRRWIRRLVAARTAV